MSGIDNLDDDFTQEERNLFDSYLFSNENQEAEQKQEEELQAQQDKLIIIEGAKYQFGAHLAEFKVLNDTPTIQDKLVGTIVETQPMNFTFVDGFQITSLGQWTGQGTAKFQDNEVLIQGSKITFVGQMPGSTTVETGTAKCIHSGQINVPESIDTQGAPLPPYKTRPKIINGRWASDKNAANEITEAFLEDTVYFVIDTVNIEDGEKLTVQLYDYDHFLWNDLWNFDDKIDSPREIKVKNNQAVMEVYLKPQWKEHIDAEKGQPFANSAIELYWKISCDNKKISEEIYPREIYNHLKVRNQREIYIKPVMSETGYNYGVPEIYTFEGEPFPFEEIFDIQIIDENSGDLFKEYGEGLLISGALYMGDKGLSKAAKGIALSKLEKGYRINNAGKILYHDYFTFMKDERMLRTFLPVEMKSLQGIDQVSTMQKKLASTRALYFIKDSLDIFGSFSSLVDLAAGGKDVNSVAADALGLLVKSPGVAILLSTFAKMTLDVMQTPVKEFFEEGKQEYKKRMDKMKFEGVLNVKDFIKMNTFLMNIYRFKEISYETMQALLSNRVKKITELKSAYNEVTILYKEIEDGILIDSFFVNVKKQKL